LCLVLSIPWYLTCSATDLFRHCLRAVLEFPPLLYQRLPVCGAEPRERCLGTSRYVFSGQELAEQVLVLSIVPPLVSDLFRHCLRSVLEFPPLLSGRLPVCRGGTTLERPLVLAGMSSRARNWRNRSWCLVLSLPWYLTCSATVSGQYWSSPLYFTGVFPFVAAEPRES